MTLIALLLAFHLCLAQFSMVQETAIVGGGGGVCTGDFNLDGQPDIMVTSAGRLQLYFQSENATFIPSGLALPTVPSCYSCGLKCYDLNNDGHLDVVFTSNSANAYVFLNFNLTFSLSTLVPPGGSSLYSHHIVDLNMDGYLDIVLGHQNGNINVFLNLQNGSFIHQTQFSGSDSYVNSIASADFDNDSFIDLVAAVDFNRIVIFFGSSNRTFSVGFTFPGTNPVSLVVDDFNGDGRPDIFSGNGNDQTLGFYENTGFSRALIFASQSPQTVGGNPTLLRTLNIDSNSLPDLIFSRHAGDYSFKTLSNLNGTWTLAKQFGFASCRGLSVVDWNSDGLDDVVCATHNVVSVFLNQPCLAGTYWNGFQCLPCPAGFSSIFNDDTCNVCPEGSYSNFGGVCELCPPGTFGPSVGLSSCFLCQAGSFSDVSGPKLCTLCPPGLAGSLIGAKNLADGCKECKAGHYSTDAGSASCMVCPRGYANPVNGSTTVDDCLPCPNNTYASSLGASECLICEAGTSSVKGSSFCIPCQPGQASIGPGSTCQDCPKGSFAQFGASNCSLCLGGSWSGPRSAGCMLCGPGKFSGTVGATNSSTCDMCPIGTFNSQYGQSACVGCRAGTALNGTGATMEGQCIECAIGYYSSAPASPTCIQCSSGTFTAITGSTGCQPCLPGFVPLGNSCVGCDAGTFAPFGATTCLMCGSGSYSLTNASSCSQCETGTFSAAPGGNSSALCLPCLEGTYGFGAGQSSCQQCPPGTFNNATNQTSLTSCFVCPINTFSDGGASECISCGPGLLTLTNRSSFCIACEAGSVPSVNSTGCDPCASGYYAQRGQENCTLCGPGSWSESSAETCIACPAGKSSVASGAVSNLTCSDCGAGRYALAQGSSTCDLCPAGTASAETGASSYPCVTCPPGTFSSIAGSSVCTNCSSGFISTQPGSAVCIPCQAGTFQALTGESVCTPCAQGTTNALVGQAGCSLCLPGRYPQTPTSGCVLCPPGTTSDAGDANCTTCALGLIAPVPGSPSCYSCPAGQSASNPVGPCEACQQQGYYLDPFGACQPCPSGTFSAAGGCQLCQAGEWSGPASSECKRCPPGQIGTNPASAFCNNCSLGSVRYDSFQLLCEVCIPGTYADNPTRRCKPCAAGEEQPLAAQTSCQGCANGRVAPNLGTVRCELCARGEYAASTAEPCLPCPSGSRNNVTGAIACISCVETGDLCPLASAFSVPSSVVPLFSQLTLRAAVSGTTSESFDTGVLLPPNWWLSHDGIVAMGLLVGIFLGVIALTVVAYLVLRKTSKDFEATKATLSKADLLYTTSHKSGSMPKVMVERQTVFGAFVGLVVVLGFAVLGAFLILNWYYSPVLISGNVPFGLAGVADPVANITMRFDLWGWTGACLCNPSYFTITGIGFGTSGELRVACAATSYSCGMTVELPTAVLSSLGTLAFAMPPPGNAMGVTYRVALSPSLNETIGAQTVSQTVWAGQEEVFGGPVPLVLSLATTWARLEDATRGTSRQGFILSPAGTSPGSTLDNATYATASDKTFRASIVLNRGTTFLNIQITYVTSIALLIGAILGYFGGLMAAGRGLMRMVELLHQRGEDTASVQEYLSSLGNMNAIANPNSVAHLQAVKTTGAIEMSSNPRYTAQFHQNAMDISNAKE